MNFNKVKYETKRIGENLIAIGEIVVFEQNNSWFTCNGSSLTTNQLKALYHFLNIEKQGYSNSLFEFDKKAALRNSILNEWHLLITVLHQLSISNSIPFKIVSKNKDCSISFLVGILEDDQGLQYELKENETNYMFNALTKVHHLIIEDDFVNNKIIIHKKNKITN